VVHAYPVVSLDGRPAGLLSVREVRSALLDAALEPVALARDFARKAPVLLFDDTLEHALEELDRAHASEAVVLEPRDGGAAVPVGVLTREAALEAWKRATEAG
jgi:CBS domain-containing protein